MLQSDRSPERARQDYVKAIYQLGDGLPVSAADLARYLAKSRAAITKSRRILEKQRLVRPAATRTDRIALTGRGKRLGATMLRRHRLIETFLHRSLGVPIDEVHAQAEALEHVISDDVAERIARFLGNPRVDPHGHPIAVKSRRAAAHAAVETLADAATGHRVRVDSIPDRDPMIVRQLLASRVLPGLEARVVDGRKGFVNLRSAAGGHAVGIRVARLIRVTTDKVPQPAK